MKVEITKDNVAKKYQATKDARWFKIFLKVLLGLAVAYFVLALGFAIAIYGFDKASSLPKIVYSFYEYPAAFVNFRPISVNEVLRQTGFINKYSQETGQPLPAEQELTDQIIDQLIDIELLRQEAKKYNISVTNDEIDEAYQQMVDANNGEEEVEKVLNEMYGMTPSDFKELIEEQLLAEKIQNELIKQVNAKHILISDENQAKEVLEKVKNGEDFNELAKEYSEDTGSKDAGGDLGWFTKGMMVSEFEEVAFGLEPGQVNEELVKTDFGYHIIKTEDVKGEIDQSFADWFIEVKENSTIYVWYEQPFSRWFVNIADPENIQVEEVIVESETEEVESGAEGETEESQE